MKTKIVLIDDQLLFREGIKRILEQEPSFEIAGEENDGHKAFELVKQLQPDIVLMDINMPTMNGIEATREIAAAFPNTKVVMLTVHDDQTNVMNSLENGAYGYLLKDMSPVSLITAIKSIAQGNKFLHPKVTSFLINEVFKKTDPTQQKVNPNRPLHLLTMRECEVLELLAEGYSNRSIAEILVISEKTVKNHLSSIFQKLHVDDRTQAVLKSIKQNWVSVE